MPGNSDKPLLLVDVDGVVAPFGFDPNVRPEGRFLLIEGIPRFLSASAGDHLSRLAQVFEPVWCTGWEETANDYLPFELGLPGPYPVISFDGAAQGPGHNGAGDGPRHWKLTAIDGHVGDRPLAWVDDDHGNGADLWAAARAARSPTLLVTTEPAVGLEAKHVELLLAWAAEVGAPGPPRSPADRRQPTNAEGPPERALGKPL